MPDNNAPSLADSTVPTPAELASAAEALAPIVRENAVRSEQLRDPVPEVVTALKEAGLHKLYRPRRYGGYGLDWGPHFTVSERLARECGSTGWLVSLVFSHVMFVGRFLPEAQEEFFANAGDGAVLATGSAGGGALSRDGSDWQLTGRWAFVSGVNVASGVMVTAREDPKGGISHFALLLPGEYRVLDTWNVEGLRGTGSHDVVGRSGVGAGTRRVLTMEEFASMDPPGAAIAESYVHRVRTFPYQRSWFLGPLLGAAREGRWSLIVRKLRARTGRLFGESIVSQAAGSGPRRRGVREA